ncbi:fumarylacetoacetate hydrolase family protein [Denitrobaculum tricleocarpae]|uniref:Fumarylacetoacetate hydrolase family protein n=1 Tax=Denitrobaculum tricleocarpae TaxID=2591009 RepID=A0A545TUJ3_9PROT|nr:fumarylacetoacetate hydrolase family protein [Denitrobaculum tricleocarpae]TQV80887.1 fumarylacetoacetate hydrolase family protein [Denitrobaculum tricleocarpae]
MSYVIPTPAEAVLPVVGQAAVFPVRRIYCVGRNYAEHAREMGADPDREPPFFFTKPRDAIVAEGGEMPYPPATENLHYEMELVVAIGTGGKNIAEPDALGHVYGYAAGLDMTRRDLQGVAKKMGRPWDMGKGFDHSAPCSALRAAADIGHPHSGAIWLKVNNSLKQAGDLSQQIWSVPETISFLSNLVELAPGDLIFTGTPAGVGPVVAGDRLEGHVDGIGDIEVTII